MKHTLLILIAIAIFSLSWLGCSAGQAADNTEVSIASKQQMEPTATTAVPDTPETNAAKAETPAENEDSADDEEEIVRPEGWGEETHSKEAAPNYDVVFPQDKVNRITITIDPGIWEAMQANMIELYGEPGSRGGPGREGDGGRFPEGGERPQPAFPEGGEPPAFPGDGERPEGFPMPEDGQFPSQGERPQPPFPEGEEPPAFPEGGEPPAFPGDGQPPQQGERPEGGGFGQGPGGPGFGGGLGFNRENPMWVTATLEFEGNTWTNVGVRYKGNSSLMSSWNSGSSKLPLKLDFDEFEDDYPEIKNQRFYGFKQLSLANGFGDETYMREAVAYDLLEEAGLVAAETAYYEVILDHGEGPVNLGLYTVIEVVDDTVIERYFGDDKGNIYEADGQAASLAEGTFDRIKDSFEKENNEDEADWSDIEALYNVLHSEERTTNPEAWRAELESIFDVDAFLEWLAISVVLQHWDTYGGMSHNFYLYHNPDTNQLTWISWDHNLVLGGMGGPGGRGEQPAGQQEPRGEQPPADANDRNNLRGEQLPAANRRGGGGPGGPGGHNVSLDKADVGDNWPLIRFLLDDSTYYERYLNYLEEAGNLLSSEALTTECQTLSELLRPYVDNPDIFDNAVQSLAKRIAERNQAVTEFLANRQTNNGGT